MEKEPSPLILDSIRIDIYDLKNDCRQLMERDDEGVMYVNDDVFEAFYTLVAKRFMVMIEAFDKLGFSQEHLNALVNNLSDKLLEELLEFEEENDPNNVNCPDETDVWFYLVDRLKDNRRPRWVIDYPKWCISYRKKETK